MKIYKGYLKDMKRYYYYLAQLKNDDITDIQDSSVCLGERYKFIDYIKAHLEICKDYLKDIVIKNDVHILVLLKDDTIFEYIVYKIKNI